MPRCRECYTCASVWQREVNDGCVCARACARVSLHCAFTTQPPIPVGPVLRGCTLLIPKFE